MKKRLLIILISVIVFSYSSYAQLQSVSIEKDIRSICEGDALQLKAVIVINGTPELDLLWTPDISISSTTGDGPLVYPNKTTIYYVTVFDRDNGFSLSDSIEISVFPKPQVIAPLDDSTCANEPYPLNPPQFLYALPLWTHNGQGHFEGSGNSLSVTYIPAPDELGRIRFILTAQSDYCGVVYDTTFITYYGATTAEIITVDQTVCSNEEITIEAVAENYTGILWRHNGNGALQNENTLTPTYIPHDEEFGNVDIILDVGGLGCDKTDTVSFYISKMYVEYKDEVIACEGDRVPLYVTPSPEYTYLWNTGETENEIVINATMSDLYTVEVRNNEGCSFTARTRVEVKENPEISVSLNPVNQELVVFPANLSTYEFYGDNNDLLYSGKSNRYDYSESKNIYDFKKIYVVAYNEFGCSSNADGNFEDIALIPLLLEVNAFSPNGDGINDQLLPGHKTTVFDRTHKILYEGWDGWDGRYNGKEFPQGTYFYVVYDDDGKIFYKGPVTLLR